MGRDEKDKAHEEEERAFRLLLRQSWFSTSLERDKSILTVASGAIGLLLTLANFMEISSALELIIFMAALASFMISIASAVWIFGENRKLLKAMITATESKHRLKILDKTLLASFAIGMLCIALLTISYAIESFTQPTQDMSKEQENAPQKPITESFDGAQNIRPQADPQKGQASYDGVEFIAPKPTPKPAPTPQKEEK